jgi:membrane associated rhomboid family serine protease
LYQEQYNRPAYRFYWGGKMTPAVRAILIANVAVFIVQMATAEKIDLSYIFGENIGAFRPWQLITGMFLHVDVWHIVFNMLALWMLGRDVERSIGGKQFLVLYFAGGIVSGLCWLGIETLRGTMGIAVGASGAVFAVLVAFAMLFPDRRFWGIIKATYFVIGLVAFEVRSRPRVGGNSS